MELPDRQRIGHGPPVRNGDGAPRSISESMMGTEYLSIRLLGGFRVVVSEREIVPTAWRLRKAGHLVKLLALAPQHQLHREHVQDTLWPDLPPDAAANNLRVTLHAARRALSLGTQHGETSAFSLEGEQLALCAALPIWVDVLAFEDAAAAALGSTDTDLFEAALALYDGDLLPGDRYESWIIERREALRWQRLELLVQLARLHEAAGEAGAALHGYRAALSVDPAREDAHVAVMRLHAVAGRRAQAIRQFQELREALQRELDVEPDPETVRLYDAILTGESPTQIARQTPTLLAPTPAVPRVASDPRPERAHDRLPRELTSFIGRETEMAAIHAALATTRLLTLSGPGGSGKTRLATRVAREARETYADGVWLVELANLSNAALLPQQVAAIVGVRESAGEDVVGALVGALAGGDRLLVLDNCEHLVEGCAELVEALLRRCPELRLLATSRETLRVPGELVWPVPALALPDADMSLAQLLDNEAARLFVERARLVRPGFQPTEADVAPIVAICCGLDGLPLAIELAATRMRAMSVRQIAERLHTSLGLGLLSGGNRTASPRQRTLRGTIEWSYRLLDEREQSLFRALSVFAGSFSLDAAERLWPGHATGSDELLDLIFHLVDKSLLQVEERAGEARYRMLETIRAYGREQLLVAAETSATLARYISWCENLVEQAAPQLWGRDQAHWLRQLDAEYDHLRAMLDWCRTHDPEAGLRLAGHLWWYWRVRGSFIEGRRWFADLLALVDRRAVVHARAYLGAGILAAFQGDRRAARPLLNESLARYQELGNQRGIGWASANLGLLALTEDDWDAAEAFLDSGIAGLSAADDQAGLGWAMDVYGDLAWVRGEAALAGERYSASRSIRRELDDERGVGWASLKLGNVARVRGDLAQSAELLGESLIRSESIGDPWAAAWTLAYQGALALAEARDAEARALLEMAQRQFLELGEQIGTAWMLTFLGIALIRTGDPHNGTRLCAAADAQRKPLGIWLTPADLELRAVALAIARAQLGPTAFDATWNVGARQSLREAVE